jgi:hypothetical protein
MASETPTQLEIKISQVAVSVLFVVAFGLIAYVARMHSGTLDQVSQNVHRIELILAGRERIERDLETMKSAVAKLEVTSYERIKANELMAQRLVSMEDMERRLERSLEALNARIIALMRGQRKEVE